MPYLSAYTFVHQVLNKQVTHEKKTRCARNPWEFTFILRVKSQILQQLMHTIIWLRRFRVTFTRQKISIWFPLQRKLESYKREKWGVVTELKKATKVIVWHACGLHLRRKNKQKSSRKNHAQRGMAQPRPSHRVITRALMPGP
jgi:hypothetical protein